MTVRIVGDCHGLYNEYINLIKGCEYSIQIGDLGLSYKPLRFRADIDWDRHKAFGGNHDNYSDDVDEHINYQSFALGNYGTYVVDGKEIFFVRGAWSIDWMNRTPEFDWYEEEQLTDFHLKEALRIYKNVKPEIVLTHDCPWEVAATFIKPTDRFCGYSGVVQNRTNVALQSMFDEHQPTTWLFGHYHQYREIKLNRTQFVGLNMLGNPDGGACFYDLS